MKKILGIAIITGLFSACGNSPKDPKAELTELKKQQQEIVKRIQQLETEIANGGDSTSAEKTELVAVTEIVATSFAHYIELQGKVDAEQNVGVTPQMPGIVAGILVAEGDPVKKGQVLATMDASAILSGIETMKTNLHFATTMYEKQKSLWEQQIGSEVQYLQAKNQKETLENQLAAMNEQYEMTKIKSPINGTVDDVLAKLGEAAAPGYPSFRVVNFNSLKVTGEVSESYSALVHAGDKVKILFPDLHKEMESKISYAAKVINPQSRTFTVESKLSGEDAYKPNMIAVLKILDYEKKDAIAIAVNLIQKSGEGEFVYVVAEEKGRKVAIRQTVTVGKIYNGQAEIVSGLSPGDQVITVGYQDLVSGQAIQF